jgi:anti-sigma-K factor RskA
MGRAHLSPDEFVDLLDGTLSAARATHLDECPRCRARAEELRATWARLEAVEAPEPSPLFWEHFSARVRAAVAVRPTARRGGLGLWKGRAAVALATSVILALTIGTIVGRRLATTPSSMGALARGPQAELGEDTEVEWSVLLAMADELQAGAEELGVVFDQGTLEQAVELLSPSERHALADLIEAELKDAL